MSETPSTAGVPDSEPVARKLLRNTAFNAIGRVWLIGTNLLLTPLILSYLGQDRFAIWVLFLSLVYFFVLADLGLSPALVKYFAEYRPKEQTNAINETLTTVLMFCAGPVGILLLAVAPAVGWVTSVLAVPNDLTAEAVATFQLGLVVLYLVNLVSLVDGVLKGFQRMDLTNLVSIVVSVPNLLGSYLVLRQGWGLPGLALVAAGVYLVQFVLLSLLVKREYPKARFLHGGFSRTTLGTLLRYGVRLQLARIAELVTYHADKLLLGSLVPIRYVTFYDLGSKVAAFPRDIPYIMLMAAFPAASELASLADHRRLWVLYERGTKYLLLLTVPLLAVTCLTAHLILQVWLGYVLRDVYLAVVLLALGNWSVISMGMIASVGAGIGWVTPLMRGALLRTGLNLLLSIALILVFGYVGALIGTLMALLISNLYVFLCFCHEFSRSARDHVRLLIRIVLLNLPPSAAVALHLAWLQSWITGGGRLTAFFALLTCCALYLVIYLIAIRFIGIFDREDRDLLGHHLPLMRLLVAGAR